MILVIGATGTTGSALLRRLADLGVPARAMVRPRTAPPRRSARGLPPRPGDRDPAMPPGIGVVPGDARDERALRSALRGVDQVFLAMGNGVDQYDVELGVVRQAAAAGVEHLVKVSAPVVGANVSVAVARVHHRVERAVAASGLDHTFLRPYAFMQNLLHSAPLIGVAGFFAGITGDTPMNMVDARDVADVAATALTTTGTRGRALVLTGPETVSYPDVARRLTALGRPTRYLDTTPDRYRRDLRRAGLPPWLVDHLVEIQTLTLTDPETTTDTVAAVTGDPPRTLDDFLAGHLPAFRGPTGWRRHVAALPLRVHRVRGRFLPPVAREVTGRS